MRVPLSWLKEYVDIGDITVDELAERLTLAGLEVVGIERIGDWWDRDKIFVGQIVRVDPHPNADRLTLPTVEYGGPEPITVVTGAPNIRVGDAGQKVALALAGAVLIDGYSEDRRKTTLKPTKIRGVRSAGMVCSERELGLSDSHEGILILPDDAPVGMPLADYLGDVVLDLDLTPNLARCFSMIGVAREVAALLGRPLKVEEPTMEATGPSIEGQIDLEIADPDLCARYTAALIKGVKIGPSPWWMQRRLTLAGMRPINNIVDITNYVMLEWGQPLHAFDYHALRPRPGKAHPPAIIVRRARPGEKMTTLDGVERQLTEDMLLICDGAGPVAIAGVMGGLESEVTDQTTDILLESANFDAINNRRTAQALRMSTEASARFGRGIAPSMTVRAARRAAQLMRELAGGEIAQGLADLYPRPQETVVVTFTTAEVERILGVHMSVDEIVDILRRLEFQCRVEGETIHATVPDHRLDVRIPADIMEELARVYGYDRIPSTLLADELPPQRRFHQLETEEFIRDVLVGCGLQEVITYSLTSLEVEGRLYPEGESPRPEDFIRLANPLSSEREYLRRSLKASLLSTTASNLRHTPQVSIFEIAAVFEPAPGELLPREPMRLAVAMAGPRQPLAWHTPAPENMDFFDLKGVVEVLMERLGLDEVTYEPAREMPFLPGRAAVVRIGEETAGVFGEVHPLVKERFELPAAPVCLAEFDLDLLVRLAKRTPYVESLPRYPGVAEDIAVVVDREVPAEQVRKAIMEAGAPLLRRAYLFDVYQGPQIPENKKSLAFSLLYQAPDRTLTDEEVRKYHQRIVQHLEKTLGATLRA